MVLQQRQSDVGALLSARCRAWVAHVQLDWWCVTRLLTGVWQPGAIQPLIGTGKRRLWPGVRQDGVFATCECEVLDAGDVARKVLGNEHARVCAQLGVRPGTREVVTDREHSARAAKEIPRASTAASAWNARPMLA